MFTRRPVILFLSLLFAVSCFALPCGAAAPAEQGSVKIAILPFSMHTPGELHYLQSGVRDMLASRLAWQGKVQVIDKAETDRALKGAKEISINEALRIGGGLNADYVLFGSITGMGQAVSIDAKMAPVSGKAEPVSFYAQTKNLDEVIPQVNQFAQEINQKVFAKPGEKSQTAAASEAEMLATRNPEFLLPGALITGDKISYLNPNFVEVTPEGALRQPGLWRSRTFQGGILGMDLGDVDGDGRSELVTITHDKLTIYRKEGQGLKVISTWEASKVDRFVWVCVVDIYKDGKPNIYLTNLRRKNTSKSTADKAIPDPYAREEISSFVLTLAGTKVQVVADRVPYFLNTTYLGQRGRVLVGQQQGDLTENAFKGPVMEMQLRGNSLAPTTPVNVPDRCNVFNFVKADINNDHTDETILVDDSHRLLILNGAGDQMWKGNNLFSATTNMFESKVEDRRYNMVENFAIPSPILITDMNNDDILEIVINRNTTTFDKFLPDTMKYYDKGEIVSLSWDQMGMVENWKTREVDGMITSLRIGDIDGDGKTQLTSSMVLARDLLKIWDSKSTIFSYDLNVGRPPDKTAAASSPEEKPPAKAK